jgi:hypothetical protein
MGALGKKSGPSRVFWLLLDFEVDEVGDSDEVDRGSGLMVISVPGLL